MSFRVFDCATTMVRYSNMAIIAIDVHLANAKDRKMNLRATTHIHTAIGRRRHDNIKALASRNKRYGGIKIIHSLQANEHLAGIAMWPAIPLVFAVDVVSKVSIEEIHAQSINWRLSVHSSHFFLYWSQRPRDMATRLKDNKSFTIDLTQF